VGVAIRPGEHLSSHAGVLASSGLARIPLSFFSAAIEYGLVLLAGFWIVGGALWRALVLRRDC